MTKREFEDLIAKAKNEGRVLCFAHRGVSSLAPGCSMKAISLGFEMPEVDGIEFDVQKTADGKLIVYHDFTIQTDKGEPWLRDLTLNEIRKYRSEELLPEFSLVLELFKAQSAKGNKKIADIEIKGKGFAKEVMDLCRAAGIYNQCIFTLLYEENNDAVKEYDPEVARIFGYPRDRGKNLAMKWWTQPIVKLVIAYMKINLPNKLPKVMEVGDTPFISLYHKMISKEVVDQLHNASAYCIGATINLQNDTLHNESLASMKHMKECGVDVIKTDYPQLINQI